MRYIFGILFILSTGLGAGTASASQDVKRLNPTVYCLAQNIYFEARGEPMVGKVVVGHMVLNRAADRRFPRNVCSVIRQGGYKRLHRYQFSWWCDERSDCPRDMAAWKESLKVAKLIKKGEINDPTDGALWYHATSVKPVWSKKLVRYTQIGAHIFYIDPKRVPEQIADASGAR